MHSPLAAVSRSMLIIGLRLASRTSLSSPFSSPCYVGSYCSAFLSCQSCLLTSLVLCATVVYINQLAILHRAQMGQDVDIRNHVCNVYRESSSQLASVGLCGVTLTPIMLPPCMLHPHLLGRSRASWGEPELLHMM